MSQPPRPAASAAAVSFETGMLAYARSIQISEGAFFAVYPSRDGRAVAPIEILEKGVRGQTSNDLAPAKYGEAGNSNPQSVEFAVVPQGCDEIELRFQVRVMPFAMAPHACNDVAVEAAHRAMAEAYAEAGGFEVLAALYVWNLANARFAWRNRYQSDAMRVTLSFSGREIAFDPADLDLEEPSSRDEMIAAMTKGAPEDLDALIGGFAEGLKRTPFTIQVAWTAAMAPGQEIFPSQEYVRDEKKDDKLSRVLAKLPIRTASGIVMQASMHSQKIGAALRHVDVWHENFDYGAIAVNPYGGVQETSAVLRGPQTPASFYKVRKRAEELLETTRAATSPDAISPQAHFFMANLVRGGVFGRVAEKK